MSPPRRRSLKSPSSLAPRLSGSSSYPRTSWTPWPPCHDRLLPLQYLRLPTSGPSRGPSVLLLSPAGSQEARQTQELPDDPAPKA